jgi:hypothetical protein
VDKPTCATCPFYVVIEIPPSGAPDDGGDRIEACYRFPRDYREHAYTSADDWCGEHPSFPAWLAHATPEVAPAPAVPTPDAAVAVLSAAARSWEHLAVCEMERADKAEAETLRLRWHLSMLAAYAKHGPIDAECLRQLLGDDYQEAR